MGSPQMAPHSFCVLELPLQGIEFDATLVQRHESAYLKWHCSCEKCRKMQLECPPQNELSFTKMN